MKHLEKGELSNSKYMFFWFTEQNYLNYTCKEKNFCHKYKMTTFKETNKQFSEIQTDDLTPEFFLPRVQMDVTKLFLCYNSQQSAMI